MLERERRMEPNGRLPEFSKDILQTVVQLRVFAPAAGNSIGLNRRSVMPPDACRSNSVCGRFSSMRNLIWPGFINSSSALV